MTFVKIRLANAAPMDLTFALNTPRGPLFSVQSSVSSVNVSWILNIFTNNFKSWCVKTKVNMCSFLINWGKGYFSMHKLSSVPEERYHWYKTLRFCHCWERMQSMLTPSVIWLKYCQYCVNHYSINQIMLILTLWSEASSAYKIRYGVILISWNLFPIKQIQKSVNSDKLSDLDFAKFLTDYNSRYALLVISK